jgi:hypothetical protein
MRDDDVRPAELLEISHRVDVPSLEWIEVDMIVQNRDVRRIHVLLSRITSKGQLHLIIEWLFKMISGNLLMRISAESYAGVHLIRI